MDDPAFIVFLLSSCYMQHRILVERCDVSLDYFYISNGTRLASITLASKILLFIYFFNESLNFW